GSQVAAFAEEHGLKQVSVGDLIADSQRQESLVHRGDTFAVESAGGPVQAYEDSVPWHPMHHLAVVFGDIRDGVEVPVRLHSEDIVQAIFGSASRLDDLVKKMGEAGRGVVVYLRKGSVGVALLPRGRLGDD